MVFVIVFALLLALVCGIACWREEGSWLLTIFSACLMGLLGGLLGALVAVFFSACVLDHERKDRPEVELVALRNADGMSGRIYLRGGYVSSNPYFLYYEKTPEGYRPGQVRADGRVLIREEKRVDARLQVSCLEPVSPSYHLWGMEWSDKECRYTFVVPEGTVQRGFALQ